MNLDNTIKAIFTANKLGGKNHALPDAYTDTTVCGLDTTTGYFKGGMYHIPQPVTCGNCLRSLTKRPLIKIEIAVTRQTGHNAPDHSECMHVTGETDSLCDAIGGRYRDGDVKYLSETAETLDFDREAWAEAVSEWAVEGEAQVLSAYLRSVLDGPLTPYRYQSWQFDHLPVAHYGATVGLLAVEEDSENPEIWTDYRLTVTGPGVTDWQRRTMFEILASR